MDDPEINLKISSAQIYTDNHVIIELPTSRDSSGKKRRTSENLCNSGSKIKSSQNSAIKNDSLRKVKSTQMSSDVKLLEKEAPIKIEKAINFDEYDSLLASPDSDDKWEMNYIRKSNDQKNSDIDCHQNYASILAMNKYGLCDISPVVSFLNEKPVDELNNHITLSNLFGAKDSFPAQSKFASTQKKAENNQPRQSQVSTQENMKFTMGNITSNNSNIKKKLFDSETKENQIQEKKSIFNLFPEAKVPTNNQNSKPLDESVYSLSDLFAPAKKTHKLEESKIANKDTFLIKKISFKESSKSPTLNSN